MASTGGFALIAPILGQINASIGPSPSIIWVSLVYILGLAIGLPLVGRITDIFGRRYFMIGGVALGIIGSIICSTAQNVNVLIIGQTFIGLSASTGYSYAFIIGELVPMKHRFMVCSSLFPFSYPTAGFGAAISTAFILYTSAGWRWAYYMLIICNAVTLTLYVVFYFPPNFHMKHGAESKLRLIKNFDYVGTLLMLAGLILFMMGLSLGGSSYPWSDAHVIAPVVVGFVCLVALFVYESLVTLAEPLIPMHLFSNRGWNASCGVLALGAVVYYAFAVVWPGMVADVYANGDPMYVGWASCLVGIGITTGEIIGGISARHVGKTKYQCMTACTIGSIFLAVSATCTPDTPKMAMAFVFIATTAIGYNEAIALPLCTMVIRSQNDVGAAGGTAGGIRSAIGVIGTTVYVVVLTARVTVTIPEMVPPAVLAAGLPASSLVAYLTAASAGSGTLLAAVPSITPEIMAVGKRAFAEAYMAAYRTIFFTSIGFGSIAIITSCFVPNSEDLMTGEVAATLHQRGDETHIIGERDEKNAHLEA